MDILAILNRGSDTIAALDQPVHLQRAARCFLDTTKRFESFTVVAASPPAERVLGAAMMLRSSLQSGHGGGRTVILDVNIASGTMLARAARNLRAAGNADELIGIVLHSLVSPTSGWDLREFSELIVADHPALCSVERKHLDGSDDRVVLAC